MSTAIFYVVNPTQYFNALELIHQNTIEFDKKILIYGTAFENIINEINRRFNIDVWDFKFSLNYKQYKDHTSIKARRQMYLSALELIKKYKPDYFVVGNFPYDTCYPIMLRNERTNNFKIIALDDGIPSINILTSRNKNADYSRYHISSLKRIIKSFLAFRIILPLYRPIESASFYTIYHDMVGSLKDKIIPNKQLKIRSYIGAKKTNNQEGYFVGSSAISRRIMKKSIFIDRVFQVNEYYKERGIRLHYITHRNEKQEIHDEIQRFMSVRSFDLPIELELALEKEIPGHISSFFSSALVTLRDLFSEADVKSFRIEENDLSNEGGESIKDIVDVYDKFKEIDGIKIVDFNTIDVNPVVR